MVMDLFMGCKYNNFIVIIMLISDVFILDVDSVDFVVLCVEVVKIIIYLFGFGMIYKLDIMIELFIWIKVLYIYVKDWMMFRECFVGCFGVM